MIFLGSVYRTNGSADLVFATLGKNWQKKTKISEVEGSRTYFSILTGGTDLDRSRFFFDCPSMLIKKGVRVLRQLS